MSHTMAINQLRTLLNTELKDICKREGLAVSGVKATLQDRIQKHLEDAISRRDQISVDRIHYRILHRGASPDPMRPTMPAAQHNQQQQSQQYRVSLPNPGQRTQMPAPTQLKFRSSPFYDIVDVLSPVANLDEVPQNRNTVTVSIVLSDDVCGRLRADPQLKVMLYCTTPSLLGAYDSGSDIAFPAQMEVKLNQEDVKSNYKGLKNKPGTTKPADLTSFLRKQPRYPNNLQISYALTSKRYTVVVNLVKKKTPDELLQRIKNGRGVISKEQVLEKMAIRAKDTDIEATSTVLSLKDPVSTMRMDLPCRSTICTHNQCFDGLCFLQLQEQAPTWTCPICNKTISYEALHVDDYVLNILKNTSQSVEQVMIEPMGEWKEMRQNDDDQKNGNQPRASYDDDSDDELVEIDSASGVPLRRDIPQSATPAISQHMTPPLSSREASVAQNGRNKRPSAVIDLTLSDEDEPPRPAKRTHVSTTSYHTPSSMSDRSQDAIQRPQPPPPPTLYSGFAPLQSPQSIHGTSPRPPDVRPSEVHPPSAARPPSWSSHYYNNGLHNNQY